MIPARDANSLPVRRPWYRPSLTVQIFIGLVVGGFIGWLRPDWGNKVYFLRDIFLNLIKAIIAPLVFSTIVAGIAGAGSLKKVGRMGFKAIVYFEIATTAALFIGLAVVNFTKPGVGVALVAGPNEIVNTVAHTHPKTLLETITHIFPASIIDAMARGNVLQIVAFSVLFAMAVSAIGEKGKIIVQVAESLMQVMFKFTNYVMMFAPIGVGAAMAHTIGTQGLGVLLNLGNLILSLYLALVLFIVLVFGSVILLLRIPLRQFVGQSASRRHSPSPRRAANRPCPRRWNRWNALVFRPTSSGSSCRPVIPSISTARPCISRWPRSSSPRRRRRRPGITLGLRNRSRSCSPL